jgi:hypothetical protein
MIQGNPTVSAVTLNSVPAQVSAAETRDRSVETLVVVRRASPTSATIPIGFWAKPLVSTATILEKKETQIA